MHQPHIMSNLTNEMKYVTNYCESVGKKAHRRHLERGGLIIKTSVVIIKTFCLSYSKEANQISFSSSKANWQQHNASF